MNNTFLHRQTSNHSLLYHDITIQKRTHCFHTLRSLTQIHFAYTVIVTLLSPLGVSGVLAEPNPFAPDNGPVVISYDLNSDDARMPFVTVRIYNIAGQFVRELVTNEPQGKGRATVEWDGLTESAEAARNGRYVVQVKAEDSTGTETALGTVVLVK